ncbi:hypothetical protein ACFR9U_16170 [Halorientalis brevis]|uniref:Uncharacterized protein n=1 Tax=Halorientalis brevis TaxID=1126241 RepID=A0ABD6CEA1_9EURY|nr:hypothetical protein [Halorientalis brevis]
MSADAVGTTAGDVDDVEGDHEATEPATVDVPAYYAREIAERELIARECPVDVFVSGINPRYGWPYRMQSAREARPSVRDACETLIIDSVFQDPHYPIEEILDAAHDFDADYVVSKDYWALDGQSYPLNEMQFFAERYKRHPCEAEILVPVGADPSKYTLERLAKDIKRDSPCNIGGVAVGALSRERGELQADVLRRVREIVGPDVHVHALGMGTDPSVIGAIRESIVDDPQRPLVDSLDTSTPENAPKNNKLPDKRWSQKRVLLPEGDKSSTVRAQFAAAQALMLAYELTTWCDDDEISDGRSDLSRWG